MKAFTKPFQPFIDYFNKLLKDAFESKKFWEYVQKFW